MLKSNFVIRKLLCRGHKTLGSLEETRKGLKDEIQGFIKAYVATYKCKERVHSSWRKPIVAFADAQDPLFGKLKDVVDPNHLLPSDLLPDAKTVISYFLPFPRKIVESNVKGKLASKAWAQSYTETNRLIADLNAALSGVLEEKGFRAMTTQPTHNFDKDRLVSDWSHKHIAYIAGLGKFGLHHMIITEKGCCGRIGSIVTNAKIKPTRRSSPEFCLYKLNGSCGVCVGKCRHKALKTDRLDKQACYEECLRNAKVYSALGVADVCGKCVAEVPCSFENPSKS